MNYFSIQCTSANNVATQEKQLVAQLQSIASNVSSVLSKSTGSSALRTDIRSMLRNAADDISEQQGKMARLSEVLYDSVEEYEATEKGALSLPMKQRMNQKVEEMSYSSYAIGGIVGGFIGEIGSQALFYQSTQQFTKEDIGDCCYEYDRDWTLKEATALKQNLKKWDDKQKKWGYETDDSGKFVKKEEKKKKEKVINAGTIVKGITLYSHNYADTDSLVSGDEPWLEGGISGKAGNIGGSVEVLTLDRYAGYNIGAGGISAAAGYKVAAISASGSGQLGNDMLGVHGKVEVEALTAGISGKGAISYLNEKGEIEFNANIGAEAGAYLGSASLTGGVDVLGADIDVTGSVEVGIGAHAEFGIEDGKFKVDVGAAVGIGFSVDLEIDISEPVGQVAEWIGDTYCALFS